MMKKMKKYLAFALAIGLLLSAMTVMAEEAEEGDDDYVNYVYTTTPSEIQQLYKQLGISMPDGKTRLIIYTGLKNPGDKDIHDDPFTEGDLWFKRTDRLIAWPVYLYDGSQWIEVTPPGSSGSKGSSKSKSRSLSSEEKAAIAAEKEREEKEKAAMEQASRESVRLEAEAAENGFENAAQMQSAKAADKSAGEYYNNAVLDTQGIEEATPVAQGGSLIVDGEVTNMTASVSKAPAGYVDSVRAAQEGTVLNVVDVQFPATEAIVNFYMPGVADGANIAAVQYVDGAWVDVEVIEVRADHVVLDLKGSGIVAFLKK